MGLLLRTTFVVALAGCGARTGLELPPPPPIDAGPDGGPPIPTPALLVVVTADNSYRFGFGDARRLRSTFGAAEATVACDIFCCSAPCTSSAECGGLACGPLGACEDGRGAEIYLVPEGAVTSADFLYMMAWSDDVVTQGVLADVRSLSGRVLARSGDPGWSVCATGRDYDSGGPGDPEVADWLARCDRGEGPSGGWVTSSSSGRARLAVGEGNDAAEGVFPLVCGVEGRADSPASDSRWMWIDTGAGEPFRSPQPEFLIFRLATRALLP